MNTADLTEKLKEIMVELNHPLSDWYAEDIAKQLAPEIEKLMPRWIPVSERLPDEGQMVDITTIHGVRRTGMETIVRSDGAMQFGDDECTYYACQVTHWMPIMKGPMG